MSLLKKRCLRAIAHDRQSVADFLSVRMFNIGSYWSIAHDRLKSRIYEEDAIRIIFTPTLMSGIEFKLSVVWFVFTTKNSATTIL